MPTFTINAENNITAYTKSEDAAAAIAAGAAKFTSLKEFQKTAAEWPSSRLVDIWNGFAGVAPFDKLRPVKKFTDRSTAATRIWNVIQTLAPTAPAATPEPAAETPAPEPAAVAPQAAETAKEEKATDVAATIPREFSKKAIVLDLLKRPTGATLDEIMKATDWQAHSVRGFISGNITKKMGLMVESSKNEAGARTYRIAQ